ncbi:MAG TPA: FAD-dependent oxidoreductase [bacterium]|nr:FAD-dependent oxidoreductase [bacterium]HPQ66144.1 FAD-dependent oxidoreductase [bacterium]
MPEPIEFDSLLLETVKRTEDIWSFRFLRPPEAEFRPGQFFQLLLPTDGGWSAHYLSFSSSPRENAFLECTKRLSGSDYSRLLRGLRPGDEVRIRMPMGKFIYEGSPERVVFIAGGIGITPFRSIIATLAAGRVPCRPTLLYCARSGNDLIFTEDFAAFSRRLPGLDTVYFAETGDFPSGGRGRRGRLTPESVGEEIPDYLRVPFYLCGPPAMVEAVENALATELSVDKSAIIKESLAGYGGRE